jgi:hypothetical protein
VTVQHRHWRNSTLRILQDTVQPSPRSFIELCDLKQPATMTVGSFLHHVDEVGTLSACPSTALGVRELAIEKIISDGVR